MAIYFFMWTASGGVLFANSGKKYPKNAAKTYGFGQLGNTLPSCVRVSELRKVLKHGD